MMLDTVVTFKDLLILAVGVAVIILVIELIKLTSTLNKTLKKTNGVLDDTKVITTIAAEKAQEIDTAVDDAVGIVTSLSDSIKGRQGFINSVGSIASAAGAIREILVGFGIISGKPKEAAEETETAFKADEIGDEITE